MRWKFWKKAAPTLEAQPNPTDLPSTVAGPSLDWPLPTDVRKSRGKCTGQRKKRHFEASCMAGADTGDEEFVFEGFERGAAQTALRLKKPPSEPLQLSSQQPLEMQSQHQQQQATSPSTPPPLPPRKKQSHSLPRFLRRAASVGRKAALTSATAVTAAAANAAAVAAEKAATSSDEGFPSTSSGDLLSAEDDTPLAYCPHCRAVVQPLTLKKRSQIRTNPWVKERKRPRIDGVIQKSLDSGIYDEHNRGVKAEAQMAVDAAGKNAETESVDLEEEAAGSATDEERPVSLASQPELGGSDSSTSDDTSGTGRHQQQKRKVRRKRRRRLQIMQQHCQQQPEQLWQQRWDTPCATSSDEDPEADAEVLAIHTAATQPLSIVEEGVACMGFVPQEQLLMATAEVTPVSMSSEDSSSLWWDMDRRHLLLMMAPPPDTSSSSASLNLTDEAARQTPVLHSETEFDSPPCSDSTGSDSEFEFDLLHESQAEAEAATPVETKESLAETVQRLAAQRESLERRFREPPPPPPPQALQPPRHPQQSLGRNRDSGIFARELERYRRELLLRALASVRDQLDSQMTRLERTCSGAVEQEVRQARESFLRQVSDPCGRRGGGGDGGFLAFPIAADAHSEESISYH